MALGDRCRNIKSSIVGIEMSYAVFDTASRSITFQYQTTLTEGFSMRSNLLIGNSASLNTNDSIQVYNTQKLRKASILLYEQDSQTKEVGLFMMASNLRDFQIGIFGASNNSNAFLQTTGATDIAITTSNIERMRFAANGNIGVGTTRPLYPIHIQRNMFVGLQNTSPSLVVENTSSGIPLVVRSHTSEGSSILQVYGNNTTKYMDFQQNGHLQLFPTTSNLNTLSVGTTRNVSNGTSVDIIGHTIVSGNLGIGTTLPNYPLHLIGSLYTSGSIQHTTLNRSIFTYRTATEGGSSPQGIFINRALNTIEYNDIPGNVGITTASSSFALPAGTYHVSIKASAYQCGYNRLRLYNTTTASAIAYGHSHFAGSNQQVEATLDTIYTAPADYSYRIQHWTEKAINDNGLGVKNNTYSASDDTYVSVLITKYN